MTNHRRLRSSSIVLDVAELSKASATATRRRAGGASFLAKEPVPNEPSPEKSPAQTKKYRELDSSASTLGGNVPVEMSLGSSTARLRLDRNRGRVRNGTGMGTCLHRAPGLVRRR